MSREGGGGHCTNRNKPAMRETDIPRCNFMQHLTNTELVHICLTYGTAKAVQRLHLWKNCAQPHVRHLLLA